MWRLLRRSADALRSKSILSCRRWETLQPRWLSIRKGQFASIWWLDSWCTPWMAPLSLRALTPQIVRRIPRLLSLRWPLIGSSCNQEIISRCSTLPIKRSVVFWRRIRTTIAIWVTSSRTRSIEVPSKRRARKVPGNWMKILSLSSPRRIDTPMPWLKRLAQKLNWKRKACRKLKRLLAPSNL